MSAQLLHPGIPNFASDSPFNAETKDAATAWRNYIGYWGTYTVNETASIVTHHVEGSAFPNWTSQDQLRSFKFISSDRLQLEAEGPGSRSALIWQRVD